MKTFSFDLSPKCFGCLCEALRRYSRFNLYDLREPIIKAWTGLGYNKEYECVTRNGYMTWVFSNHIYNLNQDKINHWFKLTDKGAAIVYHWIKLGYTHEHIENDQFPPNKGTFVGCVIPKMPLTNKKLKVNKPKPKRLSLVKPF